MVPLASMGWVTGSITPLALAFFKWAFSLCLLRHLMEVSLIHFSIFRRRHILEDPWHGDTIWREMGCSKRVPQKNQLQPPYRHFACEDLTTDLIELNLD